MSWNNVSGIKNIKIWTDFSDSTQGHLFVNDQHQLSLNVGLSFNLKSGTTEGPTEDEVKSALSLINNQDSGPLKYLVLADSAGRFNAIYDPYYPQAVPTADTDPVDDGIYDFQFTYIVSSPTSLNAKVYSESVALKLEYTITNSDGTTKQVIQETSAAGSATKTAVVIVCYPSVLYGKSGENRKNLTFTSYTVADEDCWDVEGHFNHSGDRFKVFPLGIDDPYFKIFYFDGGAEPDSSIVHNPYFIRKEYSKVEWDHIYNSFFPNIKCGEFDFDVKISVRSDLDDSHDVIVTENITVHQQENQITFLTGFSSAQSLNHEHNVSDRIYLRVYDQFGNNAYVVVYAGEETVTLTSVS